MKQKKSIRSMLGNRYHLHESVGDEKEEWKLFVKYDGWMEDGSKPIMTSETYTRQELEDFSKKREILSPNDLMPTLIIMAIIMFVISVINIFIKIEFILGLTYGHVLMSLLISSKISSIKNRNERNNLRYWLDVLSIRSKAFKEHLERQENERTKSNK